MRHQSAQGCRAIHNYISLALPSQVNEITGWDVRGKNVKALETWHKKLTVSDHQLHVNNIQSWSGTPRLHKTTAYTILSPKMPRLRNDVFILIHVPRLGNAQQLRKSCREARRESHDL